ncbi:MAG: EAL domain-containing protein, partial [Atopobiaceae bacterium]|nr:EAL domain-containing protein [Atopobiaceae bacterium]
MHSIRFKVTAITIAEILTAMLCVFVASYYITQSENDRRSVEMMDLVVQDTSKSMEEYVGDIARSVDLVANIASDMLDGVTLSRTGAIGVDTMTPARTPEQTEQLNTYINSFAQRLQVEFAAVVEHTIGVQTYYFCVSPNISSTEHGFYYSHVGRTGFYRQKPFIASELDPNDLEHSGWYFTPVMRGRPSWIGPFPAKSLHEMLICSYVVPIYKSGTLIGILGMDIPLDTLVSLVSSIHAYDTGFACLLNEDGSVIYHPEQPYGSTLDLDVDGDVFKRGDSSGILIRYTAATGRERQMSFRTISTGMKLMVVAPTDEINASSLRLTRVNLPIGLVIIAVFAVLTLIVMGQLTKPLQRLTAASLRLADADYDVELDYRNDDEVGSLTTAFRRMRDQIEADIEDLNRRVLTDDLTGLPNQRHFFDLAIAERDRLLALCKRPVMLYFNLVGMKYFNRQYGFDEGDKLICAIASILAAHFGEDRMSRFAQDHFAAVSEEDGLETRLREVLQDCQQANEGRTLPVSVGIYQHSVGAVNVSAACDRAKFACDHRGDTYSSGFSYFTEDMQLQTDTFRHVINHLDEALENGWIHVYYQPIVRAANGRICDEEALSRWIDPERGFLSPKDFIPALEGTGLIYKLDLYVLDHIIAKMHLMQEAGLPVAPHSINLSRSDFEACDIVEEIRTRVDASGFSRSMFSVEITESIIGSDLEFMKGQIERFQALGFPVWMDDFGSGYSSLDFLQSIHFDLLKFDMGFMRKLDESANGKI